jgi:hypothetical protein
MPRPLPTIIEAGRFNPDSPRYRFVKVALRTAVNQLERMIVLYGDEVIARVRDVLDSSQLRGAMEHRERVAAWQQAKARGEDVGEPPKAKLDFDFAGSLAALAQGVQGALTGSTLVTTQTGHFLDAQVEVEVEIDGVAQWVRLVKAADKVDAQGKRIEASELDCSGLDYDVPAEDLFALWWHLVEVHLLPLFRPVAAKLRTILTPTEGVSSTPSSEPAAGDSLVD